MMKMKLNVPYASLASDILEFCPNILKKSIDLDFSENLKKSDLRIVEENVCRSPSDVSNGTFFEPTSIEMRLHFNC